MGGETGCWDAPVCKTRRRYRRHGWQAEIKASFGTRGFEGIFLAWPRKPAKPRGPIWYTRFPRPIRSDPLVSTRFRSLASYLAEAQAHAQSETAPHRKGDGAPLAVPPPRQPETSPSPTVPPPTVPFSPLQPSAPPPTTPFCPVCSHLVPQDGGRRRHARSGEARCRRRTLAFLLSR